MNKENNRLENYGLTELPKGWANCHIKDVATVNPKKIEADPELIAGFVPMSHAPTGLESKLAYEERTWGEIQKNYTNFKDGDVIFAKVTPCFENGKAAIVDGLPNGIGAGSSEFYVLRPNHQLVKNTIIFSLIKTFQFAQAGASSMTGAVGLRRVPRKFVEDYKFLLPPLAEQQEIARQLDTLLAQVEHTQARLQRIPDILKRFRQSVLADAVSGRLTEEWRATNKDNSYSAREFLENIEQTRLNLIKSKQLKKSVLPNIEIDYNSSALPHGWAVVKFEHIAAFTNNALKAGPFGSSLKKSDCTDSGYRVYGQEQVISGDENLVTYYISESKFKELSSCAVTSDDILISLVGTIGKVLILSEFSEPGIINPRLVKLSLQPEVNRKYIQFYLQSLIALDFFKGFSHGGTMEILNLGILKGLPINFPPLEEQTQIVARVEQLFAYADRIEQQAGAALERVNLLSQSILAKAFRGELTAQWRAENPDLISGENSAEALLARIQAERSTRKKGG